MADEALQVARRVGVVAGRTLVYVLIWAGLALLIAAAGIRYYWGKITVSQMLMNLVSVETDGGGGAIVWVAILGIGVAPLLITVGIALWQYVQRRKHPRRSQWKSRTISTTLVAAVVLGGTTAFDTTVGMRDYIAAANSRYDLGDYYVEPTVTGDANKRNLVLIYLESGEATLADDQLFEKDAFAALKEATKAVDGWQSVEDLQQYKSGGWTMGGLTATQCGIPLKGMASPGGGPQTNALGGDASTYLGGVTCLGDVLDEHGYTNVFLGGANAAFGAKDTFLRTHGYSEQKGLFDWHAAGEPEENFRSDWGLSDQRLLAYARDEVDDLHAEAEKTGRPFNLTLLTLDTHEPAHLFEYCDVDTEDEVTSVYSCSMTLVAGFVDYLAEKGYLDDTAVVIMGDHLKRMGADDPFHEQLDDADRTIFNRFWIPGDDYSTTTLRPRVDQMNMYPTILEAAGLTLQDGEAGVGVSAFAPSVPEGSAQTMESVAYGELLDSLSPLFYERAWAGEDIGQ